jgi:hypothetical protein
MIPPLPYKIKLERLIELCNSAHINTYMAGRLENRSCDAISDDRDEQSYDPDGPAIYEIAAYSALIIAALETGYVFLRYPGGFRCRTPITNKGRALYGTGTTMPDALADALVMPIPLREEN